MARRPSNPHYQLSVGLMELAFFFNIIERMRQHVYFDGLKLAENNGIKGGCKSGFKMRSKILWVWNWTDLGKLYF